MHVQSMDGVDLLHGGVLEGGPARVGSLKISVDQHIHAQKRFVCVIEDAEVHIKSCEESSLINV